MAKKSSKRAKLPLTRVDNFRVFISYSRKNKPLFKSLVAVLNGCERIIPVFDQQFAFGHGFPEQIRDFISHAHVFLPLITAESRKRSWVQQEIGYAMALNVPVLPVCDLSALGSSGEPPEMLRDLQAIQIDRNIEKQAHLFSTDAFANLVSRYEDPILASYKCSELNEERAAMMVEFS